MFERYTEKARRAVFFARYEAGQFGQDNIGPEHLLLGILREDKVLFRRLGINAAGLQESVLNRLPKSTSKTGSIDIPFSRSGKVALNVAATEAESLKSRHIGLDHLLLGTLKQIGESPIAAIILENRISYNEVRGKLFNAESYVDQALRQSTSSLDLSKMHLVELPPNISSLTDLELLNISDNALQTLPESIGDLQHLESLDVSFNNLKDLPVGLMRLRSLKKIDLRGNHDLNLPEELSSEADAQTILSYYFRAAHTGGPLNEAKLVLVGRGGAGKTSLVRRLIQGVFDPSEKETKGIEITQWKLHIPGKDAVRLHVWDFGGQEIMHATHQFFLTERSLYLIVLSGRENMAETDAEYWLKLIDSFSAHSPVIIVLNKCNQHPFDINRRLLERKYPIRQFVQTDCMTSTGIEELREAITRETDALEHLRALFPAHWFGIKNTLANNKKDFLTFEEYRSVCSKFGENDPSSQERLAFSLHSLGIVLNYKDDPRLEHTHVLNPHWVTNGIYAVLNATRLKEQKGEMRLRDLDDVLAQPEYPPAMRHFLVDLMKKFELCFSFADDESHYLIPELLDIQEPGETGAFVPDECLNFQYHYDVLPEGLLPRFIVRTNVLSDGLSRWRTGVVLALDGNEALVKADREDRKILIYVKGPTAGRRRLLAVVRSDFERIHRSIRNLKPKEMVPVPAQADVVISYDDLLLWESEGRDTYPVRIADTILDLNVGSVLDGVDFKARRNSMAKGGNTPAKLFYSYSHKDETLRNELETHLKILQRQGLIEPWNDRDIDAGQEWKQIISENLETAAIILLLVSADFIASDYCYDIEMKRALERHANQQACVIPVVVREANWKSAPFGKLQALPKDGKAVMEWSSKDAAWRNVSEGIERAIKNLHTRATK